MKKTFIIRLILTILMAISMTACEYPADMYTNAKLSGGKSVNGIVIKDNAVIGFDKSIADNKIVKIPNGVSKIEERAFQYCPYIEEVIIPDSVTEIGECAFSDCAKLNKIILSENVDII